MGKEPERGFVAKLEDFTRKVGLQGRATGQSREECGRHSRMESVQGRVEVTKRSIFMIQTSKEQPICPFDIAVWRTDDYRSDRHLGHQEERQNQLLRTLRSQVRSRGTIGRAT